MEPMKPMTPMEPMTPMGGGERWWSDDLGAPSTSGSQNGMRYAVFGDKHRLVIEENGRTTTYDTGDHRIGGVAQQDGHGRSLTFTSQNGTVDVRSLKTV